MSKNSVNSVKKSGNTKQISPSKYWCFTLNNYNENDINILKSANSAHKLVFQEEIGAVGTPHLQGFMEFTNRVRPLNMFEFSNKPHWEKKKGTVAQCVAYCSKQDTRKPNTIPFSRGFVLPKSPRIITNLRDWQREIVEEILQESDSRRISWYWETKGNMGKSALVRYLVYHHQALVCSGRATDMKYLIIKYKEKYGSYPNLIVFDVPRTQENFLSYQGIEEIKNGCFCNTKYECEMVLMDFPHVIVMANFEPNREMMSQDRWNVVNLRPFDSVLEELLSTVDPHGD